MIPRAFAALGGQYRWGLCLLLFFITTVNYMDRQILSVLKPVLDGEMHWSNSDYGRINAIFQASYAVGLLFFGWVMDRWSVRIGYVIIVALWSLAALGHMAVYSLAGFFVARLFLGFGEGGNFPAAIKTVAEWFPKKERSLATSLLNSGANIGAVLVPLSVPWIAATWGWRYSFVGPALAGFVWIAAWLYFYRRPSPKETLQLAKINGDGEEVAAAALQAGNRPFTWGRLLTYRQAWSFVVAKFLTDPVWYFLLIWLPDYFNKTRGLAITKSWVHLVTIYTLITLLSIAGGWLTGHLIARGWSVTRARKTGMFGFALAVLPLVFVTQVGDWQAVLLIGLAGAAHQAWSATIYTSVSDMFPTRAVASIVGLGGMAGALAGIAFPLICGWTLDTFEKAGNSTGGYALLFGYCSTAYLLAFGLNHWLAPKFNPIKLDLRVT